MAALVGQVIEDVTFTPLDPGHFRAELLGEWRSAQYKPGGLFVFADLPPGTYTLCVTGAQFQRQEYVVSLPMPDPVFAESGDDELVVVVKTVNRSSRKISFDPVIISRPIRAGAPVLADAGFSTNLAAAIDLGRATEARLGDTSGLKPGSIVRMIRGQSIRLRFDPYAELPAGLTRIVGRVTLQANAEILLAGAQIRLTAVNGASVALHNVAGARIATVVVGGSTVVLGTERDIMTTTNQQGDFNLYVGQDGLQRITLTATLAGYRPQTSADLPITAKARNRVDFGLVTVQEAVQKGGG